MCTFPPKERRFMKKKEKNNQIIITMMMTTIPRKINNKMCSFSVHQTVNVQTQDFRFTSITITQTKALRST